MKNASVFGLILLFLSPAIAFGQTTPAEPPVIEAALDVAVHHMFPYVKNWVVSPNTESLTLGNAPNPHIKRAQSDYAQRNAESISLRSFHLSKNVALADLSQFERSDGFNWQSFEHRFGAGTWTARVSRPGFIDQSHALVRIDVWRHETTAPPATVVIFLTRQDSAQWLGTDGIVPAVQRSVSAQPLH